MLGYYSKKLLGAKKLAFLASATVMFWCVFVPLVFAALIIFNTVIIRGVE